MGLPSRRGSMRHEIRKDVFDAQTRAEYAYSRFGHFLKDRVLDVGSGGSVEFFRSRLGRKYVGVDISSARSTPDVKCDFEKVNLPFRDGSFDTVMCCDVMEHVDDPHRLFDECARVAKSYVIISLPNNWPGLLWDLLAGHNRTHRAGYGLPGSPPGPGQRHKWFFNLEEAETFVRDRAKAAGLRLVDGRYTFERGNSAIVYLHPYPRVLDISLDEVRRVVPAAALPFVLFKYLVAVPLSWGEEIVKRILWGGGRYRYLNLFCRQFWAVLEHAQSQ